jgi:Xaa-Pro aminopeptidase
MSRFTTMATKPRASLIAALAIALWVAPLAAQPEPPPAEFFARHREDFMAGMAGGIAIFAAAPEIARNDDANHPYRQGSDFWYLTGFEEPEAIAVLRPGAPQGQRYALFVRPRDPDEEVWTGYRAGVEGARERYGAEIAYVVDSVDSVLRRWLAEVDRVYWDTSDEHPWAHEEVRRALEERATRTGHEILPTEPITSELRLVKSEGELEYLQKAIDVTTDAHRAAMAAIRPGMCECQVEALIEYVYRAAGSPRVAFNSIVGSGPNSTILHYEENQRTMDADDMVVMDIGAEWNYYAADVTRTVPVDGSFSPEQRTIYQIVLDAQNAAMEVVRPGITIRDVHRRAVEVVIEGLIRAGLLSGTVETNLESGAYQSFFMHGTSHWLGLDVHDVGSYIEPPGDDRTRARLLRPGMVFSVEPGIYIAEGMEGVGPRWWNIGVRIEDDVVVTSDGYRLMSGGAPRAVDAIEALMVGRGLPDVVPPQR